MLRLLSFILIAFMLPLTLHAAEQLGPSQKIPAGGVLRGNFTEDHYFTNSPKPLRSEGQFLVAPGRGILWVVQKPLPLTFVFTPQGMAQSFGGLPYVQTPATRLPVIAQISGLIGSAMAGDWDALDKIFVVSLSQTPRGWIASLTPRSQKSGLPFSILTAEGSKFVEAAKATRLDGGTDTFTFFNEMVAHTPPTMAELTAFAVVKGQNP